MAVVPLVTVASLLLRGMRIGLDCSNLAGIGNCALSMAPAGPADCEYSRATARSQIKRRGWNGTGTAWAVGFADLPSGSFDHKAHQER
jgi:hypothetical protein